MSNKRSLPRSRQQLADAEARLVELLAAEPRLASAASLGEDADEKSYTNNQAQIAATRDKIAMHTKAIEHQEKEEAAKASRVKKAEQSAIIERGTRLARKLFTEDYAELSRLMEPAIKHYRKMQNTSRDIVAALPLHQPIRTGLMLGPNELRLAVALEIARLDNVPVVTEFDLLRTFPRPPGIGMGATANPASIKPLSEVGAEALAAIESDLAKSPVFPSAVVNTGSGEGVPAVAIPSAAGTANATERA